MANKKQVKAWAVVKGSYLIEEYGAFGIGCGLYFSNICGVYRTRKDANNMRLRWKNADGFIVVRCTVNYEIPKN